MLNTRQTFIFNIVMKPGLFLCLFLIALNGFSQDRTVSGIVFDKESKDRIASVNIQNVTTKIAVYNNLKGEFKIKAKAGDQLIFSRQEFKPDTIVVQDGAALAIYLTRLAIQLKEVTVRDTVLSPEQRLEATKLDYTKIYGSLAYNDFLSTSGGSAGLSIDALWNALSRSGRNATKLRETIESDYRQNVIDYRFNRNYVGNITGLKGDRLTAFMFRYRPGYYTTKTASEYEFVSMIRANLRRFLRRPSYTSGPPPLVAK